MNRVTALDFETGAIGPRPAYPPRPVGVALWEGGHRASVYHAWGHPVGNNADERQAKEIVRGIIKRGDEIVMHNAKFDLEVLSEWASITIKPEQFHDTMLLGFLDNPYAPDLSLKGLAESLLEINPTERDELQEWILANVPAARRKPTTWGAYISCAPAALVGRYATADVRMTRKLFDYYVPRVLRGEYDMSEAYLRERKLIPILIDMERRGIPLLVRELERDLKTWRINAEVIRAGILKRLRIPKARWESFVLAGDSLADALESRGFVKEWVYTPKGSRSVAADSLIECCTDAKLVSELETYSQINTCISTFALNWLEMAKAEGRIYTNYSQTRTENGGARTGRLASSPNLQNVIRPKDDERVPRLRNYIAPPKGWTMFARDYSQQELRILAHFEDGKLLDAYRANPHMDAHATVSGLIQQVTGQSLSRYTVKTLNFGTLYGMGARGLARKLQVEGDVAARLRKAHAAALPGIKELQGTIKARVKAGSPIVTWGGRRYYVEKPRIVQGQMRSFEYKLLNYLIQGSGADCTKQAMINYHESCTRAQWEASPLSLQIHDELLGVTSGDVRAVHKRLAAAMADVDFDVPMLSDGKSGKKSWGTLKPEKPV